MSIPINNIDLSCYEDVIGISRTQCECYKDNPYYESLSDIYLDELEGLNLKSIFSLENCENGEIWDYLKNQVNNAILNFIKSIHIEILKKNKLKYGKYEGIIGRRSYKNELTLTKKYGGTTFYCNSVVDGVLRIKKIGTFFSKTGSFTINIYNNLNEHLYQLENILTVANTYKENVLSEVIELPLQSDFVDNLQYFILYEYNSDNKPKDIQLSCNCGGFTYTFTKNKPYFNSQTNKKEGWANYLIAGSHQTDELDFMNTCISTSNYTNGLLFDVETSCNIYNLICKGSLDFENDPNALSIAHAIRYYAGFLTTSHLITMNQIKRGNMINRESLEKFMMLYKKEFDKLIPEIAGKIDINKNDCFACDDKNDIKKSYILV